MSMLNIIVRPKTRAQLERAVNPQSANQPEAISWVYYDTQSLATASAGPLNFFTSVQADRTLGNLEQPGTIPDPFYFEIVSIGIDFLVVPDISATFGPIADLANFLHTTRATFTFALAGKEYLRIPATFLTCSGAPVANATGSTTAGQIFSVPTNGVAGTGGFKVNKSIVIPPKQSFVTRIELGAASTLTATRNIRLWMAGVLHRRVL